MSSYSIVSKFKPLKHNNWGNNCDALTLVDNEEVSIKFERMPPATEEVLHYHNHSQQFFYILKGTAVFEVDNVIVIVHEEEGLHLEAGSRHRIINKEEEKILEFIVYSQPPAQNDRQNIV